LDEATGIKIPQIFEEINSHVDAATGGCDSMGIYRVKRNP
jgi:hypothetical protein